MSQAPSSKKPATAGTEQPVSELKPPRSEKDRTIEAAQAELAGMKDEWRQCCKTLGSNITSLLDEYFANCDRFSARRREVFEALEARFPDAAAVMQDHEDYAFPARSGFFLGANQHIHFSPSIPRAESTEPASFCLSEVVQHGVCSSSPRLRMFV